MDRLPPRFQTSAAFPRRAGICRFCGKPIPPGRVYCDTRCRTERKVRTSNTALRGAVFDRDRGVCVLCRFDCTEASRLLAIWRSKRKLKWIANDVMAVLKIDRKRATLWDADHVVAVSAGGGACGIANVRTLCVWCHRRVTDEQAAAKAGRPAACLPDGATVAVPVFAVAKGRAEFAMRPKVKTRRAKR